MKKINFDPKKIKTEKKAFIGYETYILSLALITFSALGLLKKTIPFLNINLNNLISDLFGFWGPVIFIFVGYLGVMELFRRKIHSFLISKLSAFLLFIFSTTIIFYNKAGIIGKIFGEKLNSIMSRPLWFIVACLILILAISLFVYHSPFEIIKKIYLFIKEKRADKKIIITKEKSTIQDTIILQKQKTPEAIIETNHSLYKPISGKAREVSSIMDLMNESKTKDASKVNVSEVTPIEEPIKGASKIPYKLPSKDLLNDNVDTTKEDKNKEHAKTLIEPLLRVLINFDIPAEIENVIVGPSVTRFELRLTKASIKVSKILTIQDDIKMNLAAKTIRIQAPIPGKTLIGIEVPNRYPSLVNFKSVVKAQPKDQTKNPLSCALGKNIEGVPAFIELNKTPHMLVAGATGSGKSVFISTILASILLHATPKEVRLLLVDPKMVEFAQFSGIPHLLAPIITDPKTAAYALTQAVEDMETRYKLLAANGTRNIEDYNAKMPKKDRLAYIVIIIDELADLMMVASKDVETSIARITQKARAAGIHLILATQRPSINVVTGLIKANIPTRVSFAVSSSIDSRTILDSTGAEGLLGKGDMLIRKNGGMNLERLQGAFIDDDEIDKIIFEAKRQREPDYNDQYLNLAERRKVVNGNNSATGDDLYDDVKRYVIETQRASSSLLQRRFSIGYGRAARLIDALEAQGIVGPSRGSRPREVLIK